MSEQQSVLEGANEHELKCTTHGSLLTHKKPYIFETSLHLSQDNTQNTQHKNK